MGRSVRRRGLEAGEAAARRGLAGVGEAPLELLGGGDVADELGGEDGGVADGLDASAVMLAVAVVGEAPVDDGDGFGADAGEDGGALAAAGADVEAELAGGAVFDDGA